MVLDFFKNVDGGPLILEPQSVNSAHLDLEVIKPISTSALIAHYCVCVAMITDVSLRCDDGEKDGGDDGEGKP